jgi:bacterioferritin (cytochrome b1)
MRHAEKIEERLFSLGSIPIIRPAMLKVGGELWEMVDNDIEAEETTIANTRRPSRSPLTSGMSQLATSF